MPTFCSGLGDIRRGTDSKGDCRSQIRSVAVHAMGLQLRVVQLALPFDPRRMMSISSSSVMVTTSRTTFAVASTRSRHRSRWRFLSQKMQAVVSGAMCST
jgi:hypothetical protein